MGGGFYGGDSTRSFSNKINSTYASGVSSGLSTDAINSQIFGTKIHEAFHPKNVIIRESRDSEDHPNSLPIILGCDNTGSMGFLSQKLVVTETNKLMTRLLSGQVVPDVQIMTCSVGDIYSDGVGIQLSQFESDYRILEQQTLHKLIGGGGGNGFESYELVYFVAGAICKTDAFEKRGQKGFCFTFGDDAPNLHSPISRKLMTGQFSSFFEKTEYQLNGEYLRFEDALRMSQEKFHTFHVVTEEGGNFSWGGKNISEMWRETLGNYALRLRNSDYMSELVEAVIRIRLGEDFDTVIESFSVDAQQEIIYGLWME